jgi:dCMP deaminase
LNFEQWDHRFLQLAETVATWSKDPSTKVGSVIVDSKRRVIGLGYNGFPRGIQDLEERYSNRETKLKLVCHAERNALDNTPISVEGSTLYATLFPCNECCKSIIQRGVAKVVTFVPPPEKRLLFNYDISYIMLKEAGVELYQYSRSSYERWLNGDMVKGQSERQAGELNLQNQIHEAGWYGS